MFFFPVKQLRGSDPESQVLVMPLSTCTKAAWPAIGSGIRSFWPGNRLGMGWRLVVPGLSRCIGVLVIGGVINVPFTSLAEKAAAGRDCG